MNKKDKIIVVICLLVCGVCFGYLGNYYRAREKENEQTEKLEDYIIEEEPEKEDAPEPEKTPEVIPIDFVALQKVNPDIYAWIEVPGTRIKGPIVQSPTDDAYYLDHLYDKSESPYGAIFTEHINTKEFQDFNTVIYGHNTRNVTGFHDLHQFSKEKFFREHNTVVIYTEEEKKEYRIFAAVEYDDRHILYHFNNENPEERKEFLVSLQALRSMKNQFRKDVIVNENSHMITLSTCIKGEPGKRWIVEAVEIDE